MAYGRASSNLAFGTILNRALNRSNTVVQGFFAFMAQVSYSCHRLALDCSNRRKMRLKLRLKKVAGHAIVFRVWRQLWQRLRKGNEKKAMFTV